jgi:HEAT repeat protein
MKPAAPVALGASTAAALDDPRPEVREATLATLKDLYVSCEAGTCTTHPDVARAALPHAMRALGDPDPGVRVTGIRAIELFATDAGEAVFDLVRAAVDPVEAVRLAALEALCELGTGAAPAALQVAERLAHAPTPEERSAAAAALGNASTRVDDLDALVDALVDALIHDVAAVQASAAHALGLALDDEREDRRSRVSRALHRLSRAT